MGLKYNLTKSQIELMTQIKDIFDKGGETDVRAFIETYLGQISNPKDNHRTDTNNTKGQTKDTDNDNHRTDKPEEIGFEEHKIAKSVVEQTFDKVETEKQEEYKYKCAECGFVTNDLSEKCPKCGTVW